MKIYLFLFYILFSGFVFSQKETLASPEQKMMNAIEMKKIERFVDSIRLDKNLQQISMDSILLPGKLSTREEFYTVEIYSRGDELVRISLNPLLPYMGVDVSSSTVDYFFNRNQLIYIGETYTDNSRPGLCGKMDKENSFYNLENKLTEKVNGPCAHACCEKFIAMNWLIDMYDQVYKIATEKKN